MLTSVINFYIALLLPLNILLVVIVVFYERRNPAATWAWLMVISFIPVIGFIIYLLLGQDSRKYRVFARKNAEDEALLDQFLSETPDCVSTRNLRLRGAAHLNDMAYMNFYAGGGTMTSDNQTTLFHEGHTLFDTMLADMDAAKHFIFFQTYILRDDATSRRIINRLAEKASAGVAVYLLIDGMGCIFNSRKLYRPLLAAGGHKGVFMPPHFIRMNFRNHRKLVVIDGVTGYIGGFNVGDEYLGLTKRFGYWRDTHMRVYGGAVRSLSLRFIMDWNFTVRHKADKLTMQSRFFPKDNDMPANGVRMQIVSSGPDTRYPNVLHAYYKMITEAERSIYIQTPYFVPEESLFGALRVAALSGIDVRIMIPANPDHPFVYWAGLSYLGELLEVGVKCYEYQNGFIHCKTIMIDSLACSVGTANMDVRSFKLNFECNAFIYDAHTTRGLEAAFIKDMTDCTPIELNQYHQRSKRTKIKESLSRLISPLL